MEIPTCRICSAPLVPLGAVALVNSQPYPQYACPAGHGLSILGIPQDEEIREVAFHLREVGSDLLVQFNADAG